MSISSINTNLAALLAQSNIGTATQNTSNDVAALSSGNRIVSASTDVAALAAGTALVSQVNTLNTALTVASQGSSLLQVADGSLAQIQSILQRQQAITTSAQSGSLSSTQLGFLDQEFQSLTQEINQLASSTNFNGVNLIDGSIAGGTTLNTNTANGNGATLASATILTVGTNPGSGTATVTVNGVATVVNFTATAGNTTEGSTANGTAANIAATLNNSGNPALSDYRFSSDSSGHVIATYNGTATTAANIPKVTTTVTGTNAADYVAVASASFAPTTILTASGSVTTGDSITVNGVTLNFSSTGTVGTVSGSTLDLSSSAQAATVVAADVASYFNSATVQSANAALQGFTFGSDSSGNITAYYTGGTNAPQITSTESAHFTNPVTAGAIVTLGNSGLGTGSYSSQGTIQGSGLFVDNNSQSNASDTGLAVDLSKLNSNSAFIGNFGGSGTIGAITANYIAGSSPGVTFSTVVGGITYTTAEVANSTLTSNSTPVALTFTGTNTTTGAVAGGSFTLNLQAQTTGVTSQTAANNLAAGLNTGLSGVSVYQNRNVLSYNNTFSALVGSTQTANLSGSSLTFNSNSFANPLVSSVTVSAPTTGETDAKISVVVNGQTYNSQAGIGDTIATNTAITLTNSTNPDQTLTLLTGSTAASGSIAIDLSSASNAAAFQTTLSNALGVSTSGGGLSFQVGSSTADSINITIGSASASSLFSGASLDVKTQADAATAATAVGNALNTVTALRATVGASEERFNFASSAISSAAQNENAARSSLLDTDVASTSTNFATAQVQLQAGIAVLAQANQLQQNLLKLIA